MMVGAIAFSVLIANIVRWPVSIGIANPETWLEYATIFAACVVGLAATFAIPMAVRRVGFALHYHALRRRAANADEVLSKDARPPVLYFRSFEDDSRERKLVAALNSSPALMIEQSAEAVLAEYLAHIGPLVAVGRPGEALPELGFARMYVDHEGWQAFVALLIDRAALVVLRAGHSEGVLWETAQVLARVPLDKVIVLLPSNAQFDYEAYRRQVHDIAGTSLPKLPPSRIKRFPLGVQAIVRFDASGKACLCTLPEPGLPGPSVYRLPDCYHRWATRMGNPWFRPASIDFASLLVRALQPMFSRHALVFEDPARRYDERMRPTRFDRAFHWFAISAAVIVAALFVFACVMLFLYGKP
jgi:hypothetical protein